MTPIPDRAEVDQFLKALDPSPDARFTFQSFDDNKERKEERRKAKKKDQFAKIRNGTLAQHWNELVKLNAQGAGIFVTVNETDGKGREKSNVVRIRALFVDLDGALLLERDRVPSLATRGDELLPPTRELWG